MDTTIDKYDYWLFRKPLQSDTIAENVLQHGVGGLNIDGCRINTEEKLHISTSITTKYGGNAMYHSSTINNPNRTQHNLGRWPANIILDDSDEVDQLFPDTKPSKQTDRGKGIDGATFKNVNGQIFGIRGHNDFGGSASRFFYKVTQDNSIDGDIDQGDVMDTNNEDLERQFNERVTLYLGNCLDVLKTMESDSVDSIVTDPPAGISFMNKHWDTDHGHRDQWIAYFAEIAKECLRVIKPGGHALVWAIPRTSHWTATAWENGGWEVRDRIIYCFGSGFPKSHNISKAIDKLATAPATDAAKQWDGWGTALKPAVEDWWLLRKPLSEDTIAENVLEYGVGGLNIDKCRIEYINDKDKTQALAGDAFKRKDLTDKGWSRPWMEDQSRIDQINQEAKERAQLGRWPANLIHDGSEEVTELFPDTGGSTYKAPNARLRKGHKLVESNGTSNAPDSYGDSGSAARFFYTAKASKSDRNEGLTIKNTHATVKPTSLMQYLCRLITPPDGIVLDPFMGSGSTGKACMLEGFRFIGIDMEEEYVAIARARIVHALKPEVQEYYKKKQSKGRKVKEAANEEVNEEGDLS